MPLGTSLCAIDAAHAHNATLDCEIADVRTWAALSLYLADKLRGGVALATAQWDEVIRITRSHLQTVPLMHLERVEVVKLMSNRSFFWDRYRDNVQRVIEMARSR